MVKKDGVKKEGAALPPAVAAHLPDEIGAELAIVDIGLAGAAKDTIFGVVRVVYELDQIAVVRASELRNRARECLSPDEECTPQRLQSVEINGVTVVSRIPDLYYGAKENGAEVLLLVRESDRQAIGYFTYFTGGIPDHLQKLAGEVSSRISGKPFFVVDTAVSIDDSIRHGYMSMMGELITEYRQKTSRDVDRLYAMVRISPNQNEALRAHGRIGWEPLNDDAGKMVSFKVMMAPEAYPEQEIECTFGIVYFDLYSAKAEAVLAKLHDAKAAGRVRVINQDRSRLDR